jgi:hypothetical protein
MQRGASSSPRPLSRHGVAWRVLWGALVLLVVVLPALDLACGEMPRHGHPCPLHANFMIGPMGLIATPGPLPSSIAVVTDPTGFAPSFTPAIFVPPRP